MRVVFPAPRKPVTTVMGMDGDETIKKLIYEKAKEKEKVKRQSRGRTSGNTVRKRPKPNRVPFARVVGFIYNRYVFICWTGKGV
jgi:hypothetical protein